MKTVRHAVWVHGPLKRAKLVPLSLGRHIQFEHIDGHRYQCTVPDVDFEGPACDVSLFTKGEHQALSLSYEKLERTYFYPFAKPKTAPRDESPRVPEPAEAGH